VFLRLKNITTYALFQFDLPPEQFLHAFLQRHPGKWLDCAFKFQLSSVSPQDEEEVSMTSSELRK
jgi:hypothetical protein